MFKWKFTGQKDLIMAVVLMVAILGTSCSIRRVDDNPPSAPLLTATVEKDGVRLAWSESYDDEGLYGYKLYRDGDVIKELSRTEYIDRDVEEGKEYEYYVIAYDEAGNRSAKSVKQRVKITEESAGENSADKDSEGQNSEGEQVDIQKLSRSTVKLYQLDDDLNIIAMGSGTIINKEGYILTNFHCVGDENGGLTNKDGYVAVALTDDIKKNIQPQYIAQFRSGVQELDLAVVKIVSDLNWNPVSGDDLNLVPAKITDSDKVKIGDEINILGYPGVGGETITFTAGRVSGFIDEDGNDEVDWIKTDAVVNHGNSGGTAVNQNGEMIGVPTAKLVGEDNDIMFFLKPINQALPIVDEAIAQGDSPELPNPGIPEQNTPEPNNPQPEDPGVGEVAIYGRILDSYTLEPIPGATFAVLKEGVTIGQFSEDPQDSMILSFCETDADGSFICTGVPAGGNYSVIVGAEGYNSILEDEALNIPADAYGEINLGDINLEMAQ